MKKLILTLIALAFISVDVKSQTASAPSVGDGSASNPYEIETDENLYWISQDNSRWDAYFVQTNDIDLSSYSDWPVIGDDTRKFMGSYNGQNYTISNLTIDKPSIANVGLFGHVGYPATIKNLGLTNVDIKGARGTGSLVGRVTGSSTTLIQYCFVDVGTVVGNGATGGLVGSNNSYKSNAADSEGFKPKISKCYANVDVSWSQSGLGDKIGGIAGCNQKGITEYSFASGSVTVDNSSNVGTVERVGGLAGCTYLRGEVTNSYSATVISTTNVSTKVGGLVGYASDGTADDGTVTDSYWDTEQSGESTSGGGTGLTTADMQNPSSFSTWSTTTWSIVSGQYPQLYESGSTTTILPVELLKFEANVKDNCKLFVRWETASEYNNKHFEVQLSENGLDFETVSITKGAGDSKSVNTYEFLTDYKNDLKYIRLKQVDFDGAYKIYGPLYITPNSNGGELNAIAFPNPCSSAIKISFDNVISTDLDIGVYNIEGVLVKEMHFISGKSEYKIETENLASGVYFIKSTDGFSVNQKFVIKK